MKKAIYTVITNNYDTLKEPLAACPGWDFIAFVDKSFKQGVILQTAWQIRYIVDTDWADYPEENPVLQQRYYKILPHIVLPDYDITCYIDGSTQITRDINELMQYYKNGMLLKIHLKRNCYIEEANVCIQKGKDIRDVIVAQVLGYERTGLPAHSGLWETGFMIRGNTDYVNELMYHWWGEVSVKSIRDQISLPYAMWRVGKIPNAIHYSIIHQYIKIHPHSKQGTTIHYGTPGRGDKNIGKSYNDFCSLVPAGDWICLRDGDSMFLMEHWAKQIEDIIQQHGAEYSLIGCTTNRLRTAPQLYTGATDSNPDILDHRGIAEELYTRKYTAVKRHPLPIAGLCMIFNKDTWTRVGGFKEHTVYCDTEFGNAILHLGGRIGIAEGLYIFHYYRMHKNINDKKHLL